MEGDHVLSFLLSGLIVIKIGCRYDFFNIQERFETGRGERI